MRARAVVWSLFLVGVMLGADAPGPARPTATTIETRLAREHAVLVTNDTPYYAPGVITVRAGEVVHWRSRQAAERHSVREAVHGTFSLEIPPGGEASHTFEQPGEYAYRCRYHPWMSGKIVVQPRQLDVLWQNIPESLRSAILAVGRDSAFLVGRTSRPSIARIRHGALQDLGSIGQSVRTGPPPHIAADGALWFAGATTGTLVRFDPLTSSTNVTTIHPRIAFDAFFIAPDGGIWILDPASKRIASWSSADRNLQWISAADVVSIQSGPDGFAWIVDGSGRIGRLSGNSSAPISWLAPDRAAFAFEENAVWCMDADRAKLRRIDASGSIVELSIPAGLGHLGRLIPSADGIWLLGESGHIARWSKGKVETFDIEDSDDIADIQSGGGPDLWLVDRGTSRIGHLAPEVRSVAQYP